MSLVSIYTYTIPPLTSTSHSYHVSNESGGYSPCSIGSYLISDTTTFTQLRDIIATQTDRGMQRRTTAYVELMNDIRQCSNPHGYEGDAQLEYRFGTVSSKVIKRQIGGSMRNGAMVAGNGSAGGVPVVIGEDVEDEPIVEIVGSLDEIDLLVIPLKHVRPRDRVVTDEL